MKKTNLSNELKTTYIEIGKLVYEDRKKGIDLSEAITQLCQKVDLGLEAIAEVEAQIEAAKAAGNEATVEETDFEEEVVEEVIFEEDSKESEIVAEETAE